MREENTEFLLRRFTEELQAAERATCPQAARAHRELANLYLMQVEPPTVVLERLSA
jgi:hypothetical protein